MIKNVEAIKANLELAKKLVESLEGMLETLEADPSMHVFEYYDDAISTMEEMLIEKAREDCEGSYNCGDEIYTQQFYVKDYLYEAKLEVEYNRHDKTYYYIDGTKFEAYMVTKKD